MAAKRGLAALLLVVVSGCDGASPSVGLTEPLRVAGAQFVEGDLPIGTAGPPITTVNSQNNAVPLGETGKALSGDARSDAYTVALRFEDIGTGYWVVPVGPTDLQTTTGDLGWTATCDFARDPTTLPIGNHTMGFIAADRNANWGPVSELPILIESLVPTGDAVFSLTWDDNADLDIHVVAPDGKELDPKHVTTSANLDAGLDPDGGGAGVGILDRDSNGACVIDGLREEDVVFQTRPAPGRYLIRVDLFAACGQPSVNWTLTIYGAGGAVVKTVQGLLLNIDADGGGTGSGLLVAELDY
jgi:hypothetical protein